MHVRVAALMAALMVIGWPASGQSIEERVARLEEQVAELWQAVDADGSSDATVPAELVGNEHLRWGYPGGDCTILVNEYFVTCHDDEYRIPEWVAYHLTAEGLSGDAERSDKFRPDPELEKGDRAELADYVGSGYDRGHMAPAAAFKRSEEAMSQTFVLSNMAPQTPALNRQMWRMLEEDVRELVSKSANIWVFTGSLFVDEDGSMIEESTFIGENEVAVPTHFFKVLLAETAASSVEVFAFIMANQHEPLDGEVNDYLVSVDLVEALSGLDFFSALTDSVEEELEEKVATSWGVLSGGIR